MPDGYPVSCQKREQRYMEKSEDEERSSPLATVEEIQRRLVRPPSLHPQSSTASCTTRAPKDTPNCGSSLSDLNSTEIQKRNRDATNKRLEDYLDPVLLCAIRAKIGGKRKRGEEIKFEWPVEELKGWTESLRSDREMKKWKGNEAEVVDLGDHVDDQMFSTPFQLFEGTALKRFGG